MTVIVQYDTLDRLPPVLSLLLCLKSIGEQVFFIGLESPAGKEFLRTNQIEYAFIEYAPLQIISRGNVPLWKQYVLRAPGFLRRRKAVCSLLNRICSEHPDAIIWFQQLHAAALLGNHYRYFPHRICTLFELNDRGGSNWIGFDSDEFMHHTQLVVCEYNRAWIMKSYYKLETMPFVLTNKPYMHPRHCNIPIPDNVKSVFDAIGDRPVFLYQGYWDAERRDALKMLEVIARCRSGYCVVAMPAAQWVEEALKHYSNAFTIPFIPAPGHLAITSRATVGVAAYSATTRSSTLGALNSLYCAPNKIYEYAGYGIPILCNDIPGLRFTVGGAGAGICCEMDEASILSAADKLVNERDKYSRNATCFFDSIDLQAQVKSILSKVRGAQ